MVLLVRSSSDASFPVKRFARSLHGQNSRYKSVNRELPQCIWKTHVESRSSHNWLIKAVYVIIKWKFCSCDKTTLVINKRHFLTFVVSSHFVRFSFSTSHQRLVGCRISPAPTLLFVSNINLICHEFNALKAFDMLFIQQ